MMPVEKATYVGPCAKCRTPVWLPQALEVAALASRKIIFYCAYGHPQYFPEGECEVDKMRRERDRARQQVARAEADARAAVASAKQHKQRAAAFKGQVTKLRMRAKAGVCPCCNRQFEDLYRHMTTKHPDMMIEPEEPRQAATGE